MPNMIPGGGGQTVGHVTTGQSIFAESATKLHRLGDRIQIGDRVFYYAKASEALAVGKLSTSLPVMFDEDTVTVAHPIGTTQVTVTASATIAVGQLEDGYLCVDEGTGAGEVYRIKSNPAITSGATGVITLYDELRTAWVIADTDISMYTSIWNAQESNTGQKELPLGTQHLTVTSGYYFWMQTWGPAAVLADEVAGNATNTRMLTIGSSTAGSYEVIDAIGEAFVGQAVVSAADNEDAKYQLVYLQTCP